MQVVEGPEWVEGCSKCVWNGRIVHKGAAFLFYFQGAWVPDERPIRQLCLSEDIWEGVGETTEKNIRCDQGKTHQPLGALLRLQSSPKSNWVHSLSSRAAEIISGRNLPKHSAFDWESKRESCASKMLRNFKPKSLVKNSAKNCLKCKFQFKLVKNTSFPSVWL